MNRRNINQFINAILPVSSAVIGSPRNRSSIKDYCHLFPEKATFKKLDDDRDVLKIPDFFFPRNVHYAHSYFTASLRSARVWGRNGAVIGDGDYFLDDVSREFDEGRNVDHSIFYTVRQIRKERINGNVAVIGTAGAYVYYHWMLDVLPRMSLLAQNDNLEDIDFYVTEFNGLDFQIETLERLKIPVKKIIASNENWNFHIVADTLYVPSLAGPIGQPTRFQVDFLRALYSNETQKVFGSRKIYISRRLTGRRVIINEHEFIPDLEKLGFEIIDCENMSVSQQATLFSEASVIIGSHGSAFTNLIFCREKTKVLDLFNRSHTNPCFWIIAQLLNLDYNYLSGSSVAIDENPKSDNTWVDRDALLKSLETMRVA